MVRQALVSHPSRQIQDKPVLFLLYSNVWFFQGKRKTKLMCYNLKLFVCFLVYAPLVSHLRKKVSELEQTYRVDSINIL